MTQKPVALTTTFTPSSSCTAGLYLYRSCSYTGGYESCRYFHLGPDTSTSDCLPPSWRGTTTTSYYSPGVCPIGYWKACTNTVTAAAGTLDVQAVCCPWPYTCQTETTIVFYTPNKCTSRMTTEETMVYTYSDTNVGWKTATTVAQEGFNAFGIFVQNPVSTASTVSRASTPTSTSASTSAGSLSATPASSPASPTSPTTASLTSLTTATESSSSTAGPTATPSSGGGLSSSTKVGVGVGVSVGVLLLGALIYWFLRSRRGRSAAAQPPPEGVALEPRQYHC